MRAFTILAVAACAGVSAFVPQGTLAPVRSSGGMSMMAAKRPFVIAGNFKENPESIATSLELAEGAATAIKSAAANVKGAFTGAVSTAMLESLGVKYVLCGHSERRTVFKNNDNAINKKVRAVLDHNMSPILCIGESKCEYEEGLVKSVCAIQLSKDLAGVTADEMRRIIVAYEPVWAIGTGLTATPEIAQEVHAFIRAYLAGMYGADVANEVVIQYGGSVTPETVDELMEQPDIDGALVGGASLDVAKFSRIINFKQPIAA